MNSPRLSRWLVALLLASIPVAVAADAVADDPAAEALFDEGVRAMKANDYDKACPLIDRAVKLGGGQAVGGLLLLGECHEKAGRNASAWVAYRQAAAFAKQSGQAARHETAKAAIDRLEPTLYRLKIVVSPELGSIEGLVVKRNGEPVPREVWGILVPIDPGTTVVRAELPGREPFQTDVSAPKTPGNREVVLAPWGRAPAADPPPKPPAAPASGNGRAVEGSRFSALGMTGIVVGVAGAGGLAAALGLGVTAKSDYDDAIASPANECSNGVCNGAGKAAVDDARSLGDAATACTVVGAALLATGVVLLIVDLALPSSPGAPASLALGPTKAAITWRFE